MEGRDFITNINKGEIGAFLDPNSPEAQALEAQANKDKENAESSERVAKLEVGEQVLEQMEQAENETPMEQVAREARDRSLKLRRAEIDRRSAEIKRETDATLANLRRTIDSLNTDDRMAA